MIITNAHLISPGLERKGASVVVVDGKISELGERVVGDLDLGGDMLLPGFIDIHAHGAGGADVCDASREGLEHIARRKLSEGVTTWLPTTLTQPRRRLVEIMKTLREWASSAPLKIPGVHLEGPFINAAQAGAQNPEFVREPDADELRELNEIFPIKILSLAPELAGAYELIREAKKMGIISSAAHTSADYKTLVQAMDHGLKHLTHFGNAMTGLHQREIGVMGAGLLEDRLKLELIADGAHLAPEMLRLIFAKVPRKNLMLITDSISASWQSDGETDLGGLKVLINNGEARLKNGGALAGSTLRYPHGLKLVHELTGERLCDLVETTSWNQARALGMAQTGKIELGYDADFVVLDQDFRVRHTVVAGKIL